MDRDYFYFKQFKIRHNKTAMKVGTDGVLLGSWADCKIASKILDIGTGTGLLAIMLAQKSNAQIDAVEISKEAFLLAKENIENCPWKDRISVYHNDINDFFPNKTYDLIICNPPFYNTDIISPEKNRAISRHSINLKINELANNIARLISENGIAYVIYPIIESLEFENAVKQLGLYCISELIIKPNYIKEPKRRIIEISKKQKDFFSKTICIEKEKRHDYSDEYKKITKDYYIRTLNRQLK
jgi:tRNA1Val (adenine37-N6)-methyltransferase